MPTILIIGLLLFVGSVHASTICKVEDSNIGIKAIAWNDEDRTARVTDMLGKTHIGKLTSKRKHSDGYKVNIYVEYNQPYYGIDAAEYIVFSVGPEKYRVFGVNYIIRAGHQFLESSIGNYSAICITL
jgi:hypothetical protein